ncbi:MAG: ATP-binding protein [Thermoguttaceae bacterium]|nr:ATP-binding protein [Thermoguttaceae bacterium]
MIDLSAIRRGKEPSPPRIMLYGIEGVGKSTFAAGFPDAIFIPTEDGLGQIDCASFPICQTFEDALDDLNALINNQNDFKTIVIDSLSGLERLIWAATCRDWGKVDNIEQVGKGFGKGYVAALSYWEKILKALDKLRSQKKCATVLIAHAKAEEYSDPETPAFKRFAPRLQKLACGLINEWVDLSLFGTREFGAARGDKGGERVVISAESPRNAGKSRYAIPEVLPMKADALMAAIKEAQKN